MFNMELLNNIGISYIGSYISQGSLIDKCKKSTSLGLKNVEFIIRNDGKGTNFNNIDEYYKGNIIVHAPTININQSNLKTIKEYLRDLSKNNIKLVTIEPSTLLKDAFDWSTSEEQQNYLKNIARGLTSIIVNNGVSIAIENSSMDKNNKLFGCSEYNISDLLVHTKKILVEEYEYSKEEASKAVGVSLNINNLVDNGDIKNANEWFKLFYNDIRCIKINNSESNMKYFDYLITTVLNISLDVPILIGIDSDIEYINNEYYYYMSAVRDKINGKTISFEKNEKRVPIEINNNYRISTAQSGFTNVIVVIIILFTVISAVLMVLVELQ